MGHKHNRNPRRLHHQKRACWVNRIPVMSTSSWRWLTNSVKPVKRRFTNSGIRGKHDRLSFYHQLRRLADIAAVVRL